MLCISMEKTLETTTEKATDFEAAVILAGHIENPCTDSQGNNVRAHYIRLAKELIPTMINPGAIDFLRMYIEMYSPKTA